MSAGGATVGGVGRPRDALLWLRWVLADLAVFGSAGPMMIVLSTLPRGIGDPLLFALLGISALAAGPAQGWALAPALPTLSQAAWVVATLGGLVLAFVGLVAESAVCLPHLDIGTAIWYGAPGPPRDWLDAACRSDLLGGLSAWVLARVALSVPQGLVLWRITRRAWVWVPAQLPFLAVGAILIWGIGNRLLGGYAARLPDSFLALAGAAVVMSALSGGAVVFMSRRQR